MSLQDYSKALKLGEKEYRAAVAKGEYPYLPVLDDILSVVDVEAQVSLGLVTIPIKSIVGTYSAGRTTAFARNFMPILKDGSEFAGKWALLCDDLISEGLRDPIKAFEFDNKFYVVEGNKRVSVLKYMNAVNIEANITRVIPKRNDDDPNVRLYYEFLEFYDLTGINYLQVTKEGTYRKLLKYTGHDNETRWKQEDEQDFHSLYTFFEQEFCSRAGDKMSIGAGDALAAYLELYDYEEVLGKSQSEFKKDISKLWNEFRMLDNDQEFSLVLNPTEESKKQSFMKIFPVGTPVLKICFIHDRSVENSAWTYSHELGKEYVQDAFGDKVEISVIEHVDDGEADAAFESAIEAGNKVIFATSPKLCVAAVKAAINHPDMKILNCSMLLNHKNIRGYYLRTYEAKFIIGAIAGSLCEDEYVGYLADYPIRGSTAEINAFALGVQMTNPKVKVALEWTMLKDRDYQKEFDKRGIKLISGRDLNATMDRSKIFGLFKNDEEGGRQNLCMPVRHWGKMYEDIIQSVMIGAYKNDDSVVGTQALNYFWGMSSGAIDVIYSRNLPDGAVRLLRTLREGIRSMSINPFTGPIYSNDGVCRCEDGQSLSPEECVTIDWLADNIEGFIPDVSSLKDEAVDLVLVQGVKSAIDNVL